MIEQFDARGRLRHLITLEGLSKEQILAIIERASSFLREPGQVPACSNSLADRSVANLFFEP
ncbi:MAG: aspartate carbamoyltransferase catalytic subunit, partial [Gammaproteobacteria bacterium]